MTGLRTGTVANVCPILLDQHHRKLIELIEVIARIRDLPWLKTQPPDRLQNTLKIPPLLLLRIRIVVPQITLPAMMRRISKVDEDGLRMSDVEITVGFWREPGIDEAAGGF